MSGTTKGKCEQVKDTDGFAPNGFVMHISLDLDERAF